MKVSVPKSPWGSRVLPLLTAVLVPFGLSSFSENLWAQNEACLSARGATPCSICGDGVCAPGEDCPDDCTPAVCGDAICELGEDCADDCGSSCETTCGDTTCTLGEDASSCPDDCGVAVCGDQRCEAGEDCTEDCGVCQPTCGDGDIEPEETCDDGGTEPGDGCDANCQIEPDHTCTGEPSVCSPDCLPSDERCDDAMDNDCDGKVDCADPDCDGQVCRAGNACTTDALCTQGACGTNEGVSCDDGDACTTDGCNPETGCGHVEIPGCEPSPPGGGEQPGEDSGGTAGGASFLQGSACSLRMNASAWTYPPWLGSLAFLYLGGLVLAADRRRRKGDRGIHAPGRAIKTEGDAL